MTRRRARPRVHDLQPRVRLDLELDRPGIAPPGRRRRTDRSRAEPGPGSPRRPVVERRAHDGHVGAARREALVVRAKRELVERASEVDVVLEVLVPELVELVLRRSSLCSRRKSGGSLIATADATRAGLGASVFPQSGGRHDEVSVGHDLRYVGSLDRRHATFFDPIEEIEQESAPGEAPLQSVRRLRRTSDRTEALGRDTRDRPPWSCGHHRSAGSAELGEDAFGASTTDANGPLVSVAKQVDAATSVPRQRTSPSGVESSVKPPSGDAPSMRHRSGGSHASRISPTPEQILKPVWTSTSTSWRRH